MAANSNDQLSTQDICSARVSAQAQVHSRLLSLIIRWDKTLLDAVAYESHRPEEARKRCGRCDNSRSVCPTSLALITP